MRPGTYRKHVLSDLDKWIADGLVPEENRDAILKSLPQDRESDGSLWIGMAGALLAGLAVITFIADNWAGLARGIKLILLLAILAVSVVGASATYEKRRHISNALTLIASLIFAASVALIGQAFNMPGEPSGAFLAATIGGLLLSAAGRSPAAGVAGMAFGTIWLSTVLSDSFELGWFFGSFWLANLLLGISIAIAYLNRSRVMWHASILLCLPLSLIHVGEISKILSGNGLGLSWDVFDQDGESVLLLGSALFAIMWGGLAAYGVFRDRNDQRGGKTLAGYGAWAALFGLALMGVPIDGAGDALHRLLWLGASIAVMAFGAREHYGWIITAGVLSLITSITVIMVDLGLNLAAAAVIFGLAAAGALGSVFVMNKASRAKTEAGQ